LVQYLVLRDAHQHPELTRWSDNIRLLETLHAVGSLSTEQHQALHDAYLTWRQEVHRQALAQGQGQLEGATARVEFNATIAQVEAVWQAVMFAQETSAS